MDPTVGLRDHRASRATRCARASRSPRSSPGTTPGSRSAWRRCGEAVVDRRLRAAHAADLAPDHGARGRSAGGGRTDVPLVSGPVGTLLVAAAASRRWWCGWCAGRAIRGRGWSGDDGIDREELEAAEREVRELESRHGRRRTGSRATTGDPARRGRGRRCGCRLGEARGDVTRRASGTHRVLGSPATRQSDEDSSYDRLPTQAAIRAGKRPNPQMQPTGRGGPAFRAGPTLLVAKQWKRRIVRA